MIMILNSMKSNFFRLLIYILYTRTIENRIDIFMNDTDGTEYLIGVIHCDNECFVPCLVRLGCHSDR